MNPARPLSPPPLCRRLALGALLLLASAPSLPACRPAPGHEPFEAKVVGISDGDSLTVLDGTTQVRVRLHGIDCPERGQAFGTAARRLTSSLAFGKKVTVKSRGKDRYGRVLAEVVLPDGRTLNRELVAAGMAWHYARYSDDEALAKLERRARKARLGLWSEPDPVAPWSFRAAAR